MAVGDVARVEDERRDMLGRGEVEPPSWLERREAVEERFFRFGVDWRRSSLSELALGTRLGAGCGTGLTPERAGRSDGDKNDEEETADGEAGKGVAVRDGSLRRSETTKGSMGGGGRGGVLEGVSLGAADGLKESMTQRPVPFE